MAIRILTNGIEFDQNIFFFLAYELIDWRVMSFKLFFENALLEIFFGYSTNVTDTFIDEILAWATSAPLYISESDRVRWRRVSKRHGFRGVVGDRGERKKTSRENVCNKAIVQWQFEKKINGL